MRGNAAMIKNNVTVSIQEKEKQMIREKVIYYYIDQNKNCAVSMLQAANDVFGLGLTEEEAELFTGFGGGMGCGITCGALSGAIGALSGKYRGLDRDACHELCTGYVERFKEKMACESLDCSVIAQKYKVPEKRCLAAVLLAAQVLEEYVEELDKSNRF